MYILKSKSSESYLIKITKDENIKGFENWDKENAIIFPTKDSYLNKKSTNIIKSKYLGLKTKFYQCIDKTVINKKLINTLIK